ncbi:class I SAM-dependent methyltransferase [Jiangella rhizosphaerae]|uniref:Class I SAM-dependent methyltransferase n=1 Tax=Jiangella rhizosphaerae TaxID=2293569 RepID=A0A418KMZ0_9ACTN|nr:class I SAM-dependent methyltransferase [Jiangella rhizosphaerae]RIQ20276.1 class I SAM-dependent methyltransferase [Jiangella rhizosphaerae]
MTDVTTAQDNINRYWTERADSYDAHHRKQIGNAEIKAGWTDVWRRALPAPPARVLDVGTGTGHVALILAELGYDVIGTDLAEGMLEKAREKAAALPHPPELLVGDAVAPDFPPGSFDVVTNRYLLWTLRTPEVALRHWRALLRPGGMLAAVDSTWFPSGVGPDPLYDRTVLSQLPLAEAATIDESAALVRAAGFADVVVTPLPEILELDRRHGVADGHEVQLQFLITGRAA